jgi:hypothetical protein
MTGDATGPHLAQFNFARARHQPDDSRMAGFVDALDEINHLADRSPGFIWRLQTGTGHALEIRPFADDNLKLVTLSTWRDIESLRRFVYRGAHAGFLGRRSEWFEEPQGAYLVMWWRDERAPPTVEEGLERLERLQRDGPTPEAFDMSTAYRPDGTRFVRPEQQGEAA